MPVCRLSAVRMAAQPALVPPSPTAPRHGDVRRINRLREECGSERLVQVFTSLVSPGKPPTVRDIAAQLDVPPATAHRAMQSIPLRDISNKAHTQQREMLRRVVEQPAAALTPCLRPSNNQYLDNTEEEMLTKLIDDRARNEQAMGKSSIRQAAADIRSYRTGQVERLPGKTWYYDLVTRLQSGFKQVKPSAKEHKRADAERADEIKAWFAILKEHIDKHNYAPGCMFAMDETGLDGEAASRERVLIPKDLKRGSQIKGSLREHISMLHICNAAGHTLPPIFAFQGVWYNAALLEGAPVESRVVMQASGYFEQQHMLGIMQHIFSYIDSNPEMYRARGLFGRAGARLPTLLIFDGCDTHNAANAMEYAESRNMTVLRLLPNLTHLMQVADVSIFGPFKTYYSQECELWRRTHHGQLMSKYDIARVATPAWLKAASVENVVSAFAEVGQHPFKPSAVLDKVRALPPLPWWLRCTCAVLTVLICAVVSALQRAVADAEPTHSKRCDAHAARPPTAGD
jgi:hypothetical protein